MRIKRRSRLSVFVVCAAGLALVASAFLAGGTVAPSSAGETSISVPAINVQGP